MQMEDLSGYDLILVAGLPGSGKSYLARKAFAGSGRLRINRKEIRKDLFQMTHFGEPWQESNYDESQEALVKHVERKLIEQLLFQGEKLLVDNNSVTQASRKAYIDLAGQYHKSIAIAFIDTPVQICMKRNLSREDSIPPMVISNLYATLEKPDRSEGFREVLILKNEA